MKRKVASYLTIGAIGGAILGTIACDKTTDPTPISEGSDAGKPAPDLAQAPPEVAEAALVAAVEYATGANHGTPAVDDAAIDAVDQMWRIASLTTNEKGARAFASSQGVAAEPALEPPPPNHDDCEASAAERAALNELMPVLFQHQPSDEAMATWRPLREMLASADLVRVTCEEAPDMVVAVSGERVVAARDSLKLPEPDVDDAPEPSSLEPGDELAEPDELEPGGPPAGSIEVTSIVEGATIELDGESIELPHTLTGIDTSRTLRFKVKAPGHLDAKVGALPMDVLTMLQGGEPQTRFEWIVWPHPAE